MNALLPLEEQDQDIRDAEEAEWKRKEEEYFAAQRGPSAAAAAQHQEREASRDVEGGSAADRGSRHSLEKGGITP